MNLILIKCKDPLLPLAVPPKNHACSDYRLLRINGHVVKNDVICTCNDLSVYRLPYEENDVNLVIVKI